MTKYLARIIRAYSVSYTGIPTSAWFGIAINFTQTILAGIFYFLSYYFVHTLNYDVKIVGTFISCYGIGAIIGGLLGGKLSDKYAPTYISSIILVIQAASFIFLAKITNTYLIIIDTFVLGFTNYGFITSNFIWVLSHCKDNQIIKLRAINILSVVSNLGLSLSAIIVSLISKGNFYYLFISNGIILLLLAAFLGIQKTNEHHCKKSDHSDENKIIGTNEVTDLEINDYKIFIIVLTCVFIVGTIVSQMSTTYSLYIQSTFPAYGLSGFSLIFVINTLLVVLLQTPIGEVLIKRNALLMVGIGSLLLGIGMGIIAVSLFFSMVILACVIYSIGEMIFFSMAQLVCYEKAPEAKKGQQLGLFRMVFAASRVVGPTLGGIIYYHLGGNMVWYISGILGTLCFAVCVYNKKLC